MSDFSSDLDKDAPRRGEPLFKGPWTVGALALLLVVCYAIQSWVLGKPNGVDGLWFSPQDLAHGRYFTLVTALFLHGGWPHVLFNSGFALAFGAPVAWRFGLKPIGVLGFFVFYIVCGVLANLGFALVDHSPNAAVLGASGAVSGLMGGASRLMGRFEDEPLAPFSSRSVVGMAAAWISCNLLVGLFGSGLLAGGAPVAWQAHLFGYLAGLVLIGPAAKVLDPLR